MTFAAVCRVKRRTRIHRSHDDLYMAKDHIGFPCSPFGHEGEVSAPWPIQSRGPWLAKGLCCPLGSLITMASSETLKSSRRLIFFVQTDLCPTVLYGLEVRGSPICSACLSHHAISRTPADRTAAHCCSFTVRSSLRPLRKGSASAIPRTPVLTRVASRGCRARFMLRPGRLLALHRQGLLLPSFHLLESPPRSVGYHYPGKQQIPGTGLPPVNTRPYGLRAKSAKIRTY